MRISRPTPSGAVLVLTHDHLLAGCTRYAVTDARTGSLATPTRTAPPTNLPTHPGTEVRAALGHGVLNATLFGEASNATQASKVMIFAWLALRAPLLAGPRFLHVPHHCWVRASQPRHCRPANVRPWLAAGTHPPLATGWLARHGAHPHSRSPAGGLHQVRCHALAYGLSRHAHAIGAPHKPYHPPGYGGPNVTRSWCTERDPVPATQRNATK